MPVLIVTAATTVLFSDSFDRADSSTVGNAWTEVETTGANAGIQSNRLCFLDTSDVANRPLVRHTFQSAISGLLTWQFAFDWTRTGSEGTYRQFMQLGQSSLLSDANQNSGVGINLLWTNLGGVHQTLAYRKAGVDTALTTVSGSATITVTADLDSDTYQVAVNGSAVGTNLPFNNPVDIDTVRYFTDALNEVNFSGRCIDNLSITLATAGGTPTATYTPTNTPRPTNTGQPTGTPTPTGTVSPPSKDCSRTSVGFIPVIDMQPGQYYPNAQHASRIDGGLYGNYQNNLPDDHPHMVRAAAQSSQVLPRDAAGNAVSNGKIGLISIGMSNTRAEFLRFMRDANVDPLKSSAVVLVNGGQNGQTAEQWARPDDESWTNLESFVSSAGLTPAQVQVVWMKLTRLAPQPGPDDFPVFVNKFRGNMAAVAQQVRQRYPNVRLIYLSSRIYAGYSLGPLSPEPFAYEGAFANRLLIDDQIAGGGVTGINYDNAPVLLWGPYLWADGVNPNSQGLQWDCSDLTEDGVHPSSSGISKVAARLLAFFKTDPLASVWFTNLPPPNASPTLTPTNAGQPTATFTSTPTATRTATPTATTPAGALFSDNFDRADSTTVGNAWSEVETTGANAGIQANRLCFLDTSDVTNRPMAWHAFPQVTAGGLTWEFDFDWTRTGSESTYSLFMQLGQGSLMSNASQDGGTGVNLVWMGQGTTQQSLGYRRDGVTTSLRTLSGAAHLRIEANLDTDTYSVSVNGIQAGSGIPFEDPASLDTVRFFTSGLNEANFSGRCFDNLSIASAN